MDLSNLCYGDSTFTVTSRALVDEEFVLIHLSRQCADRVDPGIWNYFRAWDYCVIAVHPTRALEPYCELFKANVGVLLPLTHGPTSQDSWLFRAAGESLVLEGFEDFLHMKFHLSRDFLRSLQFADSVFGCVALNAARPLMPMPY